MKKILSVMMVIVLSLNLFVLTAHASETEPQETDVAGVLSELQKIYPNGTPWVDKFDYCYENGESNLSARTVASNYVTFNPKYLDCDASDNPCGWSPYGSLSLVAGCGGWASMVSDAIYGTEMNGAMRIAIEDIRPGDFLVMTDENGFLRHIAIATTSLQEYAFDEDTIRHYVGICDAGGECGVQWSSGFVNAVWTDWDGYYSDWTGFDAWTRIPTQVL